jgi:23S rRNA (cytosine1962-C5)-methyltransferase
MRKVALSLREQLFEAPLYRMVYAESDQLSGLIIDRYADLCVVQCITAGMEAVKEAVLEALDRVLRPTGIVLRADSSLRQLEGLNSYQQVVADVPEEAEVKKHGLSFSVSLQRGQKTGWFYDQRVNRLQLRRYVKDKRVLDVFGYTGGWGLQAAAGAG